MKKVFRVVGLAAILTGVVFLGWKYFRQSRGGKDNSPKLQEIQENTETEVLVKVVVVKRGDLPLRLSISAISEVRERAVVKNEVEGVVENIMKREGDHVRMGDVVIHLQSREKELALRQAEAARLEAYSRFISQYRAFSVQDSADGGDHNTNNSEKKEYEDALMKFKEGKLSMDALKKTERALLEYLIESGILQNEIKKIVSQLTRTEVELDKARFDMERIWIRAPFSGTIAEVKVSPGEKIIPGMEVFKIVNLSSIFLKGYILETELGRVKQGQKTWIRFLSFPSRIISGQVSMLSPEVDISKKTGLVFIDFKNPGEMRVGMNAEVDIEYSRIANVLIIPRKALIVRSGRPLVFIIENDIALWKYVETGAMSDLEVEIKSGEIDEGDRVVVEGHLTLAHQAKVKIVQ
jgi:membrane fusion protein (multidrug efflux system)